MTTSLLKRPRRKENKMGTLHKDDYFGNRFDDLPLFDKAHARKTDPVTSNFVPTGEPCVTCGQLAKEYKRPLYSSMALALIYLCKLYQQTDDWVHVNDVIKKTLRHNIALGGDLAKLQHWGLILQQPNNDSNKRTSGFWKPTKEGMDFAFHGGKVMSHVKFYNGRSNGFAGDKIGVTEALGEKFNYAELMRDVPR